MILEPHAQEEVEFELENMRQTTEHINTPAKATPEGGVESPGRAREGASVSIFSHALRWLFNNLETLQYAVYHVYATPCVGENTITSHSVRCATLLVNCILMRDLCDVSPCSDITGDVYGTSRRDTAYAVP